jgi:hypothetical protein
VRKQARNKNAKHRDLQSFFSLENHVLPLPQFCCTFLYYKKRTEDLGKTKREISSPALTRLLAMSTPFVVALDWRPNVLHVGFFVAEARGAFAAAVDAESEHEEGRWAVWTAAEIDQALGHDAALFKRVYGVRPQGNFEGRTILHRLAAIGFPHPQEPTLAYCRSQLLELRNRRPQPLRDDKVLADWNGLAIAALARAGVVFGRPGWVAAARRAFAAVTSQLDAGDGGLFHGARAGQPRHAAVLEDYGDMAGAAMAKAKMPMKPPMTETTVVSPMAMPASPRLASG